MSNEVVVDVRNKCLLYLSKLLSNPNDLDKYDLANVAILLKEIRKLK